MRWNMDSRLVRLTALLRLARSRGDRAAELILLSRIHAIAWSILNVIPK